MCRIKSDEIYKKGIFTMNKTEVLKEFAKYCDRKMLNYYLYGNTLYSAMKDKNLGADKAPVIVAMPRDDFERLHQYNAENEMSNKYKLKGLKAGKGDTPYAKFGCLEIYPLDGVPKNEKKYAAHINRMNEVAEPFTANKTGIINKVKSLFANNKETAEKLDKMATKFDFEESDYIAVTVLNKTLPGRHKKEEFLAPYIITIDGEKFNGTAAYYNYLTEQYGDIF